MGARVMVAFGTRPEAIKMAPVVAELQARPSVFDPVVVVTGQHRELLDQVLGLFNIEVERNLSIMEHGQSLTAIASRAIDGLSTAMDELSPDAVLVQGDTTTTFAASLVAFYQGVPLGHIEAGLRTGDLEHPFPEEGNRRLTTQITQWHFAPTREAARCLTAEGIESESVFVTGNTVIDALMAVREREHQFEEPAILDAIESGHRLVLVTVHRRESWGAPVESILRGVAELLRGNPDIHVLLATHPNPRVAEPAREILGDEERVSLIGPQSYVSFVKLMEAADLILSDSGGVQEEAPSLDTPVLVLRQRTERTEAIEAGCVRLVGTDSATIAAEAEHLLRDADAYARMAAAPNPFGDGKAASKICDVLERSLGK